MIYLDTSVLIAALYPESHSEIILLWLERNNDQLAISDWTVTEFSSAIAIKMRRGQITKEQRAAGLTEFRTMTSDNFHVCRVTHRDFLAAAGFIDHASTPLRTGDALHLAIAERERYPILTLDHGLFDAGLNLGISMIEI